MLMSSMLIKLLSVALTSRQDKSILENCFLIYILSVMLIISITFYDINIINRRVDLYRELFHVNAVGQLFHSTIYFISGIIMLLTSVFAKNSKEIKNTLGLGYRKNKKNLLLIH